MKEYLMLITENLENYANMTPEEMQADIAQHVKWVEELVSTGHFKGGNPLMPYGKHLSTAAGVITDGPYAEVKEGISGYYFLLAESLEQAAEIARGCPSLQNGGTLEVR
ncbi:MAG: YciI family protein, partial [Bacteroidia bacterium]